MEHDPNRVTVREAAVLLGISPEAVRARLRRGTLERETGDDGSVYVVLSPDDMAEELPEPTPTDDRRIHEEVEYLRERLIAADQRDAENRRIIAALTSRVPELTAREEEPQKEVEPAPSRGWLYKFFWGPE